MCLKGELTSAERKPITSQRSPYVMSSINTSITRLLLVGLRMSLYVFRISLEVFSFGSKWSDSNCEDPRLQ